MVVLLAVVPKRAESGRRAAAIATACGRAVTAAAGPRYSREPAIAAAMSTTGAVLATWSPEEVTDALAVRSGRWAAATAPSTAPRLLDAAFTRGGSIRHTDDGYGAFAAITGDRSTNRILAWNTAPTLEAIHYGEDREFFYVSNRPLAVALCLAARARRRVRPCREYLREYLSWGFSVSGRTPFEGVQTLPPRHSLSINADSLALVGAPAPPAPELADVAEPRRRGSQELLTALRAATRRTFATLPAGPLELRLSGGVDSRLLLGLLCEAGITDVVAVCQGGPDSEEVMVAAQLAELAGVDFVAASPGFVEPHSVLASMRASIVESQGYIPSEALVSPYAVGDDDAAGRPLTAGQWPLFKGVLERTAENSLDSVQQLLAGLRSTMLAPRYDDQTAAVARAWAASVPAMTNYELLYMWGRDIRSSRYLQPHAVQVGRTRRLAYPYVDSQVTAVADALPVHSRMTQLTSFFAIEAVWPEALAVPMANRGRFRFESTRPLDGVSGPHWEQRTGAPRPYRGPFHHPQPPGGLTDPELVAEPLRSAARLLVSSPRWWTVRRLLAPEFRALVEQVSRATSEGTARGLAPADRSPRWLRLMLWRILLVDLWLDGDWVPTAPTV